MSALSLSEKSAREAACRLEYDLAVSDENCALLQSQQRVLAGGGGAGAMDGLRGKLLTAAHHKVA